MQVMSGSKGQEIVYTWARLNTPTHKELSDTIDAALRRAKAEVLAEMKLEANGSRAKSYIVETPYNEGHDAAIDNFVKWLDARAAQIEEGE